MRRSAILVFVFSVVLSGSYFCYAQDNESLPVQPELNWNREVNEIKEAVRVLLEENKNLKIKLESRGLEAEKLNGVLRRLENENKTLKGKLDNFDAKATSSAKLKGLEEQIKRSGEKNKSLSSDLALAESSKRTLEARIKDADAKLKAYDEKLNKDSAGTQGLKESFDNFKKNSALIEKDLKLSQDKNKELSLKLKDLEGNNLKLADKISSLSLENSELKKKDVSGKEMKDLRDDNGSLKVELENLNLELENADKKISDYKNNISILQDSFDKFKDSSQIDQKEFTRLKNENILLEGELKDLRASAGPKEEISKLQQEKASLESKLKIVSENLVKSELEKTALSAQVDDLKSKLDPLLRPLKDEIKNKDIEIDKTKAEYDKELRRVLDEKSFLEDKINSLSESLAKLYSDKSSLKAEVEGLNTKLDVVSKEKSAIRLTQPEEADDAAPLLRSVSVKPIIRKVVKDNDSAAEEKAKQRALKEGEQILRQSKVDPSKAAQLAYSYAQEGKITQAIDAYKKAISFSPADKDMHYNLGSLYISLKKYGAAIKEFKAVVSLDPQDKEAYYNLALCYGNLGVKRESDLNYLKYLELENATQQ